MDINITLNGKVFKESVPADMLLIDWVRSHQCYSVKRGCETSNCGLCTVLLNDVPVLSCSVLVGKANGGNVITLEGIPEFAAEFGDFIAGEGADQCGFCTPGFMMNSYALFKEIDDPTDDEIKEFLAGNLCRCSGYEGHLRGIKKYLAFKKGVSK